MAEIIIPERLAACLALDKKWDACVTQVKMNIEPLLAKDPNFFPDYTIHGIDHINRCLDIADHLISFDTLSEKPHEKDPLKSRDVAFLVCGIMLHDIGMFLRPDGVRKLVKMDIACDPFGGKSWAKEWSDYVDRTKRLSQENMYYHFGNIIPVTGDCVEHTDNDDNKRIIGEFLRQHHARLAHEFVVDTLPGDSNTDLLENTGLFPKDKQLIGLLARSHCMAIRDTESYLAQTFGKGSTPYSIPVFYLMAVLRMADALEADERRAPEKLEKQQHIHVPVSVEEWTWNQCINPYACDWRMDQGNRYIEADPKSSPQYVQLDKWLKGVQAELDLCWSILAEKYANPNDRYRLSIHRVVSNIHETEICKTMNQVFLTKEAKITANPEIVKLMIEPLYGSNPTFGVRELLQNAVDACLERKERLGGQNYTGHIDIRIEDDTFTITDNGMGMNEDILLNYYLSAGSSYRNSDAWNAANAPQGISRVARTGRFGVGFLASFLLGNTVEVHTHHIDDEKGYHFTFDQKSTPLNITREIRTNPHAPSGNDPIGTTIKITLKKRAKLEFFANHYDYPWTNWYAFDDPTICYTINGQKLCHGKLSLFRDPVQNSDWLTLPSTSYKSYQWYPRTEQDSAEFYSNGLRIYHGLPDHLEQYGLQAKVPHVSILDYNCCLDVDLSRKYLKSVPEEEGLFREVFLWHIARLLMTPWDSEENYQKNCTLGFFLHGGAQGYLPYLLSHEGFTLNHASVLSLLHLNDYVILYHDGEKLRPAIQTVANFLPPDVPYSLVHSDTFAQQIQKDSKNKSYYWNNPGNFLFSLLINANWLFRFQAVRYRIEKCVAAVWLQDNIANVLSKRNHKAVKSAKLIPISPSPVPPQIHQNSSMPILWDNFQIQDFPVAVHVLLGAARYELSGRADSLFSRTMAEILTPAPDYPDQSLWIPFDMDERKKKFPNAFDKLKVYMDHIRQHPIG